METATRRAVFLDRDGVLNESIRVDGVPRPPRTLEDFHLIEGVVAAVDRLRAAGFVLIVVTNQPDVARGIQTETVVEAMHQKLHSELAIDDIFTCFHDEIDNCEYRKPKPGMLISAIQRHDIDASRSFMVGDRWRDITAGRLAGCRTFLVGPDWKETMSDPPDFRARDLREASIMICELQSQIRGRPRA